MKVFISYRRADSPALAGWLHASLEGKDDVETVFFDIAELEGGEPWRVRIAEALEETTHFIALIGDDWEGSDGTSRTRIVDEDDVVRFEVGRALEADIPLLPVLIDAAKMPSSSNLPSDLQALLEINWVRVRTHYFVHDRRQVFDFLGLDNGRPGLLGLALRSALGLASAALLIFILAVVHSAVSPATCPDLACRIQQTLGLDSSSEALPILATSIALVLGAGAALPVWFRLRPRDRRWT